MAVSNNNSRNNPTKPQDHGNQYDDPAYRKLSRINGDINRMTKDQLKERLANLHLDTRYYISLRSFVLELHCNVGKNRSLILFLSQKCDLCFVIHTGKVRIYRLLFFVCLYGCGFLC